MADTPHAVRNENSGSDSNTRCAQKPPTVPASSQIVSAPIVAATRFGTDSAGAERQIEPRISRHETELDAARRKGVLGLWRLRYEAWLEDKMKGPAIQKMRARQAVLEEQTKTAEAEIRLNATVQSGEVGAQRHRIEWTEVNRQRLAGELRALGLVPDAPDVPSGPPPVSVHVSGEQVEVLALRGFLKGVETEEDWFAYREELGRHLSPYGVEEVGQRLRELWRLNRQAQGAAYG